MRNWMIVLCSFKKINNILFLTIQLYRQKNMFFFCLYLDSISNSFVALNFLYFLSAHFMEMCNFKIKTLTTNYNFNAAAFLKFSWQMLFVSLKVMTAPWCCLMTTMKNMYSFECIMFPHPLFVLTEGEHCQQFEDCTLWLIVSYDCLYNFSHFLK